MILSVFKGVMSGAIPWSLLQEQYFSDKTYEDEVANLVHSPEEVGRIRLSFSIPFTVLNDQAHRQWNDESWCNLIDISYHVCIICFQY
jgi:hypothetical protein